IPVDVAMVNGIVKVFPSPTNGLVNIQLQSTKNVSLTLEISNLLGQKVVSRDITLQTGITLVNVDLSELSGGTYIVSYIDALGTRHQEKIIKQ
ncbi:MAG TPA: T9SS type A sorting domain-containing protein, partial [Candidatus Paceibacterota bacterium]|nr:T9SS type A sorting domain-containing protein [Candidatus Paceibacterota bacterium]